MFETMVGRLIVGLAVSVTSVAQKVYELPVFDVVNSTNIEYAQGMRCKPGNKDCQNMSLQLEVYQPVAKSGGPALDAKKPAYILAHGGANSGGNKEQHSFQGAAAFYAARGFVAFNIDYRLARDNGMLPKVIWPAEGSKVVSHVGGNDDRFWPHPGGSADPYTGVFQLGTEGGQLSGLCMAVEADGKSVSLQTCNADDQAQIWHMEKWNIDLQAIHHVSSGKCLDIPAAATKQETNLPVEVANCGGASTQKFILGHSGMLWCQRYGGLSVMVARGLADWNPDWKSGYPAVRDSKAAVRFVRANAEKYGVDPDRIAVSGGSAGATNMLAVGVTFDGDYKDELSVEEDSTLASTHLKFSSQVQAVVAHWSSNGEIDLIRQRDPQNRSRYTKKSAPVIEFHGDEDGIIPLAHAKAVQTEYANIGVDYELHVLEGCGHGAWCYDGFPEMCSCPGDPTGYGDHMDKIALPFVAKHLDLNLQPAPPSPPPTDNCDNPRCSSCCTGDCSGCRGYCETNKSGSCTGCWTGSDGAPPCNLRGTQCLSDDRLSCEACWSAHPLPALWSPPAVSLTPASHTPASHTTSDIESLLAKLTPAIFGEGACRTDLPECASCCTGSCTGCRGWCETHPTGDCSACWTGADGAPPCNLRGTQCLAHDGLSCELCWKPVDHCDNPLCESCCTGGCKGCKGYCETHKGGDCANCWNEAPGAPPCNLRGVTCLADDKLSCEACWGTGPLPAGWKLAAASENLTAAPPQCESCLTGSCKGCKGYCETHKDGSCAGCWAASGTNGTMPPPCNLRGVQCLADDGKACEACWKLPPSPTPPAPTPPSPTPPSPSGCPGGTYAACISMCPSDPSEFQACLAECHKRCDGPSSFQTIV